MKKYAPTTPTMKGFSPGFATLGLEAALLTTLETLGYEEPTPIQREAIPPLLAGRDLLGRAATGTGKTAAFTLPLLQRLAHSARQQNPFALILVPTRELAIQVSDAVQRYGKEQGIAKLAVYGGQAIRSQLIALKRGVDVVVATPGRALDHIRRKTLQLKDLQIVVLDEADEMLNMGFAEDLDAILQQTPVARQTALFSATMPPRIASIARRHLQDPVDIQIVKEPVKAGVVPRVHQTAYLVARPHKVASLVRILDMASPKSALVFCRTRLEVDELTSMLNSRGYRGEGLHGGMNQAQRDRVMQSFRSGKTELLVATDVAARGLDISHVSHVMNYDVPSSPEAYVHRIGRTGRAGRAGEAITLVEPRERWLLKNIERLTKSKIEMATLPTVADLQAKRLEQIGASSSGNPDGQSTLIDSETWSTHSPKNLTRRMWQRPRSNWPMDRKLVHERKKRFLPYGTVHRKHPRRLGTRDGNHRIDRAVQRHEVVRGDQSASVIVPADPQAWPPCISTPAEVAGIRPGDLVGAIANETGLNSNVIGPIKIADQFSLVNVPEELAQGIMKALGRTRIKGKKVTVRIHHD